MEISIDSKIKLNDQLVIINGLVKTIQDRIRVDDINGLEKYSEKLLNEAESFFHKSMNI